MQYTLKSLETWVRNAQSLPLCNYPEQTRVQLQKPIAGVSKTINKIWGEFTCRNGLLYYNLNCHETLICSQHGPMVHNHSKQILVGCDVEVSQPSPLQRYIIKLSMIVVVVSFLVALHALVVIFYYGRKSGWRLESLTAGIGAMFMVFYITVTSIVLEPLQCQSHPNTRHACVKRWWEAVSACLHNRDKMYVRGYIYMYMCM